MNTISFSFIIYCFSYTVDVPWKLVLMRERAAYDPAYSSLYETYEAHRSSLMEAIKEAESTEECAAERPVLVAACHLIKALLAPKPECRPSAASLLPLFFVVVQCCTCTVLIPVRV